MDMINDAVKGRSPFYAVSVNCLKNPDA